jgi:glycoprotein endo-alpha-1,2-mannosidase
VAAGAGAGWAGGGGAGGGGGGATAGSAGGGGAGAGGGGGGAAAAGGCSGAGGAAASAGCFCCSCETDQTEVRSQRSDSPHSLQNSRPAGFSCPFGQVIVAPSMAPGGHTPRDGPRQAGMVWPRTGDVGSRANSPNPLSMRLSRLLVPLVAATLLVPAGAQAASNVAIFYYPWYGTASHDGVYQHWEQNGRHAPFDIASRFFPARGLYSSGDPGVVSAQMGEIAAAGVGEVVVSWWGWGSKEDQRLPMVQRAARARGLQVAIHIEPYARRTVASVGADIEHLRALGITDFYVYRAYDFPALEWAALNESLSGVRVFAQTNLAGFAAAGRFTGLYTYDIVSFGGASFGRLCAQARAAGLLCAPSVGPGYAADRATPDVRMKLRRRGLTYDAMWKAALAADPDLVTVTSYNEWGEGTQIEPARSWPQGDGGAYFSYDGAYGMSGRPSGYAYLDRTACWAARFDGARPPFTGRAGAGRPARAASPARSTC